MVERRSREDGSRRTRSANFSVASTRRFEVVADSPATDDAGVDRAGPAHPPGGVRAAGVEGGDSRSGESHAPFPDALQAFLTGIGKVVLLTAAQEVGLAKR